VEREEAEAPAGQAPAEPPPAQIVVTHAPAQSGAPPLAIFLGLVATLLMSFGGAALVLSGAGRVASEGSGATSTPASTVAAARTPGAAATTVVGPRVRAISAHGRSRAMSGGTQYEVTFTWTLEGAHENDEALIQFYTGTRALGQQRGTLDPAVFNFSTGALTLTVVMECSTGGWSGELLTIRGQPVEGQAEASAAGVQCR
jgi:hypothetical protein